MKEKKICPICKREVEFKESFSRLTIVGECGHIIPAEWFRGWGRWLSQFANTV